MTKAIHGLTKICANSGEYEYGMEIDMTDRYFTLTVVLEENIRDDDAQPLMDAIQHLRGVLSVTGNVSDHALHTAQQRAKHEFRRKLFAALD